MGEETTNRSFDELARARASGDVSRRRALKLMGAALVGGTLASLGIREAGADPPGCKRNGKSCKNDAQCCSGNCDDSGTCADAPPTCGSIGTTCTGNTDCCSELVCKGPSGQRTCAESCIPSSATPCNPFVLPDTCGEGRACIVEASGEGHCTILGGGTGIPCTTSCDCPSGQFCVQFGGGNLCTRSE